MTGADDKVVVRPGKTRRRILTAAAVVAVLIVLALIPPLINVNRFRRKIASNISSSIGRPVRLDNVTMRLLPLPGLTIENFVVSEDPRFGAEPVMRANTVTATLRWSSLWRGRVEFSNISLDSPSVNLVRMPDGHWNIESILLQASQSDAAPTQQKRAGSAPRFPYIEATDGRLNIKLGEEKMPYSLIQSEFALWLPNPQEWRIRVKAKPVRTDTNASDTGEIRAEATLHRAARAADVPVQMEARWRKVPLGEASKILVGYDAGWRGEAAVSLLMDGTLGDASITSEVHLMEVRRADFVPARLMEVDAHCEARATGLLHQLRGVRCSLPVDAAQPQKPDASGSSAPSTAAGTIALTGDVPDVGNWSTADLRVSLSAISPGYAVDWMRLFSGRIPAEMLTTGSLDGSFSHGPSTADTWAGEASSDGALILPAKSGEADSSLPVSLQAEIANDGTGGRMLRVDLTPGTVTDRNAARRTGALRGGTADVMIDSDGFRAHLAGNNPADFLPALALRLPPIQDGMPAACGTQECMLTRRWLGAGQTWSAVAPVRAVSKRRRTSRSAR